MIARVEQDRHFGCTAEKCVAPGPKKLAPGRNVGTCVPRKTWWLRTRNSAGKRVSLGFRSEAEAREAAQKLEAAKVLGVDYTPRSAAAPTVPTFNDIATKAIELHASLNTLSDATLANHTSYLTRHLLPAFGKKPVTPDAFTRLVIREFIAAQRGVMADSTLRTSLPTLSIVLDYAVERGLLVNNPMRGAERLWRAKPSGEVDPHSPRSRSGPSWPAPRL